MEGAAPRAGQETPPSDTADANVAVAFSLGWQMAELYRPQHRRRPAQVSKHDLPWLGSLEDPDLVEILIDQVQAALAKLREPVVAAGLDPPDLTALRASRDRGDEARREAVRNLHAAVLGSLTAADFRLGKAYGLGRALADTCRKPTDRAGVGEELDRSRVANLLGWLDDLGSALPPHAAQSVAASLERWCDCAAGWKDGASSPPGEADALLLFRRQGELWRALLSGEKHGGDMLEIGNWLDAADVFAQRLGRAARGLVRRMPLLCALIVGLFAFGVWLMVGTHASASIVAGAGAILGSLGLTWKGIGGSFGRLAAKLEQPLFGAAVDEAVADAITLLPSDRKRPHKNYERRDRRGLALEMGPIDPGAVPADGDAQ